MRLIYGLEGIAAKDGTIRYHHFFVVITRRYANLFFLTTVDDQKSPPEKLKRAADRDYLVNK